MTRVHLFEFEDLQWFPKSLRNYGTDFLQFLSNKAKMYKPVIPIIEKGLKKSNPHQIVDLGSGGGGGLLWLNEQLKKDHPELKIILTDYFPNISAFEYTKQQASNFEYIKTPVDARDVPRELTGLRTQFLSFNHFRPKDAKRILQNAIDARRQATILRIP
jgi:ActR/RegA family two-component response regulator